MYSNLVSALKASTVPFAEYAWEHEPSGNAYGTIEIDMGADAVYGDDHLQEQAVSGTVDLYVRGKGKTEFAVVEGILDASDACWALYSVQYESSKRLMHYQWTIEFEVWE